MTEICSICKQPFRVADPIKPATLFSPRDGPLTHLNASDCIAAVVRRCAWIAEVEVKRILDRGGFDPYDRGRHDGLSSMAAEIRRELPDTFEDAARLRAEMGK
jgi:hypothetical protein